MKTHHILLVSNALAPIYTGMKRYKADKYYLVKTNETEREVDILFGLWEEMKNSGSIVKADYTVQADDAKNVAEVIKQIIDTIPAEDKVYVNLTGGTKTMALGAVVATDMLAKPQARGSFFSRLFGVSKGEKLKRSITGYYITQKGQSLLFPTIDYDVDARIDLSTTELLRLSGHKNFELHIDEVPEQEMVELAYSIKVFFDHHPGYRKAIIDHYNTSYDHSAVEYIVKAKKVNEKGNKGAKPVFPESGSVNLTAWEKKSIPFSITWNQMEVNISGDGLTVPLNINHPQWKYLLLGGGWWEYIVFKAAFDWPGKFSVHRKTVFKFSTKDSDKNEVDVLLNTGRKLIFLECKSGKLFSSDVNKMEIVRKLYGGFLSHTALVRYYPLDERSNSDIIERTRDLKIKEISFGEDLRPSLEKIIHKIHEELDSLTGEGRI